MTTVAEEDVLTAAELDLAVDPIAAEIEVPAEAPAPAAEQAAATGPAIRILKGNPTDAEIAALVCVLTAGAGSATEADRGPADAWGTPTLMHRGTSPFAPYVYPLLSHLR